jgi:hypothetical protein
MEKDNEETTGDIIDLTEDEPATVGRSTETIYFIDVYLLHGNSPLT